MEIATYTESITHLEPGDVVLLFTDGITEAEDSSDEEYGVERVADVAASLADPSAERLCEAILAGVTQHTDGRPLQDDATLLVVERLKE